MTIKLKKKKSTVSSETDPSASNASIATTHLGNTATRRTSSTTVSRFRSSSCFTDDSTTNIGRTRGTMAVSSIPSAFRFSSTKNLRAAPAQQISSTAATGLPSVTCISETTTNGGPKAKKRARVTRIGGSSGEAVGVLLKLPRSSTEAARELSKPSSASDVTTELGYTATTEPSMIPIGNLYQKNLRGPEFKYAILLGVSITLVIVFCCILIYGEATYWQDIR
ncbi:hypothetical protein L596_021609 [Steinernema carpocapsae]|uniref:Uncharacterized protein n=1 Tax=Steinernema carpocapsae TaxID=34508 RepID=A0A4U5MJB6_STECR|nr:hypothetical protein L596_021609 [Steinernema carpocapsae]